MVVPAQGFEDGKSADVDGVSQSYSPFILMTEADAARNPVDANAIGPTIGPSDPVEAALARALDAAAGAGRFDVVAQLAEELRARRLSAAGNVVALERAKRR